MKLQFTPEKIDVMFEGMLGPEKQDLIQRTRNAVREVSEKHELIVNSINKDLGIALVLCHSDMYSRNLMVDDNYKLKAVLDLQGVRYGNCAEDVMFLLFDVLPGKDRRIFVNHYFAEFYKILVHKCGGEPPYLFKDVKNLCH
ncbi:hypothetical protein WR25_04127 isoform B [Diploscapter pachys]|uniref:CHK kinase-like domain-containing protein n=1 Tax=Diploscapter pachys TaxID=2018661 RepID=A0A2A2LRI5_9BILA|nr:hypothetical protein WR25_04127 isoform B [Diploscapter pachys]